MTQADCMNAEVLCHDAVNNNFFCAPSCPQDPAPHQVVATAESCAKDHMQLCSDDTHPNFYRASICPPMVDPAHHHVQMTQADCMNAEVLCHDAVNNNFFCAPSCPQDPAPHQVVATSESCAKDHMQLCS